MRDVPWKSLFLWALGSIAAGLPAALGAHFWGWPWAVTIGFTTLLAALAASKYRRALGDAFIIALVHAGPWCWCIGLVLLSAVAVAGAFRLRGLQLLAAGVGLVLAAGRLSTARPWPTVQGLAVLFWVSIAGGVAACVHVLHLALAVGVPGALLGIGGFYFWDRYRTELFLARTRRWAGLDKPTRLTREEMDLATATWEERQREGRP